MKIGWEFITWSGRTRSCNVPGCRRRVNAGHVRVDNNDPRAERFQVVCTDCWFKIQIGIDPDAEAEVPQWEVERRAEKANPDRP
jgi:hypothetical protein